MAEDVSPERMEYKSRKGVWVKMEAEKFWEISRGIFQALWLILYWYYVEQVGCIEKGAGRRVIGFCLAALCLCGSLRYPLWFGWLLALGLMELYDLFFDEEAFARQWWRVLLPGLCMLGIFALPGLCGKLGTALPEGYLFCAHEVVLYLFLLLLSRKRDSLSPINGILTSMSFLALGVFSWVTGCTDLVEMGDGLRGAFLWGGAGLAALLFLTVEGTLFFYKKGYEFRTEQFRKELMEHSYGEIREIYMDMRGWRHDYHNHMQVMKAQLTMGNLEGIGAYLDKLERELDRVDTLVKSGNLMADAILNSKLTLARRQKISVNCKAELPERISVEDVDLCVILGNLLDNAIEACGRIEEGARFLRVYMRVNTSQFYLSVQNSSRAEPDFDERNYISKKRGNHGLGMKRVKAMVDKYHGYLNLANEPGIFAAEVTLPLEQSYLS